MDDKKITGKISFIRHDKNYATIDYTLNDKKKTISGNISEKEQERLKKENKIKKIHHSFRVGDEVNFIITLSARGDKMIADCIEFRYNNALNSLIDKSKIENKFIGYLKKVGEDYFIKESGSYIFFPLKLSPWEQKPVESELNEPLFFILENTANPDKIASSLFRKEFIPEYKKALKLFTTKAVIDATVYKVSPFGIFVNVVGEKIQAKITPDKNLPELKSGDSIKITITFLNENRIIVERVL